MGEYVSIFAEFETKEAAEAFLTEHGINQSIPKGGPVFSYSMENEGIYRDQVRELKEVLGEILNETNSKETGLKPCNMPCRVCGADDINRIYFSAGSNIWKDRTYYKMPKKDDPEGFYTYEDGCWLRATSDQIEHHCRTCQHEWRTASLGHRTPDITQLDEEVRLENRMNDLEDQLTDCAAQNTQLLKEKEELKTVLTGAMKFMDSFEDGFLAGEDLDAKLQARALLARLSSPQEQKP